MRIVVAGAHGSHGAESADADGDDGRFGAAGEHDLRVAHLDGAPGFADGVIGSGAGRAGGEVRAAQIVIHREQAPRPCSRMSIGIMNGESRPGPRSSRILCCSLGRLQAADAGADEHADFIAIDFVQIEAGILQRLPTGINAELGEAIRAADFLRRRKGGRGSKFFTSAAIWRVKLRRVKGGDSVDAALARRSGYPKRCRCRCRAEKRLRGR